MVLPLGEAEGGHGVPLGLVPAVLDVPGSLPGFGVEGDEPGLDVPGSFDPEFDEPEFVEPGVDDPAFGVAPFGVPGVTQGVPLGVVPGLLGDVADGCVVPGVALGGTPVGTPDPD